MTTQDQLDAAYIQSAQHFTNNCIVTPIAKWIVAVINNQVTLTDGSEGAIAAEIRKVLNLNVVTPSPMIPAGGSFLPGVPLLGGVTATSASPGTASKRGGPKKVNQLLLTPEQFKQMYQQSSICAYSTKSKNAESYGKICGAPANSSSIQAAGGNRLKFRCDSCKAANNNVEAILGMTSAAGQGIVSMANTITPGMGGYAVPNLGSYSQNTSQTGLGIFGQPQHSQPTSIPGLSFLGQQPAVSIPALNLTSQQPTSIPSLSLTQPGSAPLNLFGRPQPQSIMSTPGSILGQKANVSAPISLGSILGQKTNVSAPVSLGNILGQKANVSAPISLGGILGQKANVSAPISLGSILGQQASASVSLGSILGQQTNTPSISSLFSLPQSLRHNPSQVSGEKSTDSPKKQGLNLFSLQPGAIPPTSPGKSTINGLGIPIQSNIPPVIAEPVTPAVITEVAQVDATLANGWEGVVFCTNRTPHCIEGFIINQESSNVIGKLASHVDRNTDFSQFPSKDGLVLPLDTKEKIMLSAFGLEYVPL